MKLEVIKPNLFRDGRRCAIGETFNIDGDTVPRLYQGKVRPVAGGDDGEMRVATPDAQANQAGNGGPSEGEADDDRRAWLIDQIEELTGKRPGANSKLETLEAKYESAKLDEE